MSTFTELQTTGVETAVPLDAPTPTADTTTGGAGAFARIAGALPSIEAVKSKLADVWSRSRGWSEFGNTSQMSRPEAGEVMERVKENLEYYAFNYLVILLVLSAFTVLTSPFTFLGGIFIALAYCYLFFLNPEPMLIAGISFDNNVKAVAITIVSLIVLWLTGAGYAFTGLIFVVAVIALGHAALRKPPGEADFETAYTPATV